MDTRAHVSVHTHIEKWLVVKILESRHEQMPTKNEFLQFNKTAAAAATHYTFYSTPRE